MVNIEEVLGEISRVRDELQEMVVEKDCIDNEVLEKSRELEDLHENYYNLLRLVNWQH
ncbi:Spo0E family sporulation regulatory protein-aspartic acid phosphatase [Candidatus Contubernalis alkaliaceticus]|uniref:Spo0E family sporulation regulatory protein-aspartic acid phosphatase n=1 Tax=Candidatus Contubernalis alkaliaceticus TaxID=338645 RepID=UPI001F4BE5A4|nr:Spo0E family sporulation regulatory protein-aspartic acid phosphatase [Candidatus Contubernalis alkalaceticus]UNC92678.1 Spo0E family sporulation regulatory protein-aspartic acid phosphatase [Candidatus Contubernalis alkalaceticus]